MPYVALQEQSREPIQLHTGGAYVLGRRKYQETEAITLHLGEDLVGIFGWEEGHKEGSLTATMVSPEGIMSVSRIRHLKINVLEKSLQLIHLGETNKTFINPQGSERREEVTDLTLDKFGTYRLMLGSFPLDLIYRKNSPTPQPLISIP